MSDRIENILKQALYPEQEADFYLNQKIINRVGEKEESVMKKQFDLRLKKAPLVALSLALMLVLGGVTAYATWRLLTPDKIAQETVSSSLADAFKGKDAICVNKSQEFEEYKITLLGAVSGKKLEGCITDEDGLEVKSGSTYCAVAIEKKDGSAMPHYAEAPVDMSFFVSPLIQSYDPNRYNAMSMHGGFSQMERDGVWYRIAQCDNVELFADRKLYLCVNDGTFYNQEAYAYDETTGEITRNEEYKGVNALFDLPLDSAKADKKAAEEYIKGLRSSWEEDEEEDDTSAEESSDEEQAKEQALKVFYSKITPDTIDKYCKRVESSVQTIKVDSEGCFDYGYEINGQSANGTADVATLFPDNKPGMSEAISYAGDGTIEGAIFDTFTLNEDGTVTYAAYVAK